MAENHMYGEPPLFYSVDRLRVDRRIGWHGYAAHRVKRTSHTLSHLRIRAMASRHLDHPSGQLLTRTALQEDGPDHVYEHCSKSVASGVQHLSL